MPLLNTPSPAQSFRSAAQIANMRAMGSIDRGPVFQHLQIGDNAARAGGLSAPTRSGGPGGR